MNAIQNDMEAELSLISSFRRVDAARRRWMIGLSLLVPALIAAALVPWFGGDIPASPNTPAAATAPAMTVTIAVPARTTWAATLAASGSIAPWQEASVGTQIGNYRLTEVRVNVGDQVRRGQVLAKLDPALLDAEEAQLVAGYEQDRANRSRALGLQASGAISDQEVLQFVTAARTSTATLAAKRLQLSYTSVLAPDDGVVSARAATLGAVVPAGTELFRLIRQNRLEWRGELTASQLAQIARGQRIALKLPDGGTATATVRDTAPSLDGQSRLGIVFAELDRGSRARAGMYATGEVVVDRTPALTILSECVVIRDGRSYVLKLADGAATPKVALQLVTLGRRQGDLVEVVRGLDGTERLVRKGAGFLGDGDTVRIAAPRLRGTQS